MGRIADALKRAEQERRIARGSSGRSIAGSTLLTEPVAPAEVYEEPASSAEGVNAEESIQLVQGLSESLVPYYARSSLITEQYRSLRTRLLSQNPHYEHRTIAITSAVPKEGKSVTTLNLACILAEIRHLKVLVVDGDLRRGSLAQMLNQADSPGLADVLAGRIGLHEVIRSTPVPNMMFLPAGSLGKQSAAQLLTAARTKATFQRMMAEYHYTIIDTPPATTVSDVAILGQMCSGVVVVVRLHRTDEAAAKRAVRLLQVNGIPIMGCLLVGRDTAGGRYGYHYGGGYSYYKYYDYFRKTATEP